MGAHFLSIDKNNACMSFILLLFFFLAIPKGSTLVLCIMKLSQYEISVFWVLSVYLPSVHSKVPTILCAQWVSITQWRILASLFYFVFLECYEGVLLSLCRTWLLLTSPTKEVSLTWRSTYTVSHWQTVFLSSQSLIELSEAACGRCEVWTVCV